MYMSTAPRSARPAASYEHLRNAYSRNQRGFMYVYVLSLQGHEENNKKALDAKVEEARAFWTLSDDAAAASAPRAEGDDAGVRRRAEGPGGSRSGDGEPPLAPQRSGRTRAGSSTTTASRTTNKDMIASLHLSVAPCHAA
ncbi:unnamed protein product [Prorocentrum cordatum]|uniref:Uncharacterized protein n=1 Tax=Prorocentrum cordatum TaxID=2364126 RepID=A0ABN9UII7_9DINO|nr:unnamed protein product [Polarella glacialis]